MSDVSPAEPIGPLLELLRAAERMITAEPNESGVSDAARIRATLSRVESGTPGGAPLHAQLDNVRKWLDALDSPADHERFGGIAHLRGYVLTQLRLAAGALEDYQREMR